MLEALAHATEQEAARSEDSPALLVGRLYESHGRMVRALCRLLLRDAAEAEDAAQQTFLSAFGSLISGTVPRQPGPWLATIARRECWARTAQRRDRPVSLEDFDLPAGTTRDALEEAIRKADTTALWTAIDALPRQQRSAFLMREFSGLTYAEVAEALGATESAVESLLVRARRQLRDGLQAANLALTPVLLLRHRLERLVGIGMPAADAAPTAVRIGSAVAALAVVSGSVGGAVEVRRHLRHAQPAPTPGETATASTPLGSAALDRVFAAVLAPTVAGPAAAAGGVRPGASPAAPAPPDATAAAPDGSSSEPASPRTPTGTTAADTAAAIEPATAADETPASSVPTETTAPETIPADSTPTDALPTDTLPLDTPPPDAQTTASDSSGP